MNPLVSVVVATYRRDYELSRALESLARQTMQEFEIIVVDDNDCQEWNEKVAGIVSDFRKENADMLVRYIVNHPNQGSAKTRNVGIEASSGEFVCFLDDDDLYLPDRIKNQLIPMQAVNADYSVTDLALYSTSDRLIEKRNREYIEDAGVEQLNNYHLMYHITGTDTMMFRREYLLEIGCFSPIDVGDEFYLMQKAINKGGKFLYVPVCDVKAYVHTGEGGLSSGQSKIDGENRLFEHKKKYFERLDRSTRQYIKMRHFAVLAYAYFRSRKYFGFIRCLIISFCIYPKECILLLLKR